MLDEVPLIYFRKTPAEDPYRPRSYKQTVGLKPTAQPNPLIFDFCRSKQKLSLVGENSISTITTYVRFYP